MTKETQYCLLDKDGDPIFIQPGMDGHPAKANNLGDISVFTKKMGWSMIDFAERNNLKVAELCISLKIVDLYPPKD